MPNEVFYDPYADIEAPADQAKEGPLTPSEPIAAPTGEASDPVPYVEKFQEPTINAPKPPQEEEDFFDVYAFQESKAREAAEALTKYKDAVKAARDKALAQRFETTIAEIEGIADEKEREVQRQRFNEILANSPLLTNIIINNPVDAPIIQNDVGKFKAVEDGFNKLVDKVVKSYNVDSGVSTLENGEEYDYNADSEMVAVEQHAPEVAKKLPKIELKNNWWFRNFVLTNLAGNEMGRLTNEQGLMWNQVREGQGSIEDIQEKDKDIAAQIEFYEKQFGGNWMFSAAKFLGQMTHLDIDSAARGAQTAGALGLIAGSVAAGAGMTGIGAPLAAAIGVGAVYETTRTVEAGLKYRDLIKQGLPHERAKVVAGCVGIFNGLVEALGDLALGGIGKGMVAPVKRYVQDKLMMRTAEALSNPTFMGAVLRVGSSYVQGVGTEVSTEVIQEIAGITADEYAKMFTKQEHISIEELGDQLWQIAYQTFQAASILGLIGVGPGLNAHFQRVSEAQKNKAFFENLNKQMSEAESKKIAPDVAGNIVQDMGTSAGVPTVYVDAGAFAQTMIDQKVSIDQLAVDLPEVAKTLTQKVANGELVEIPMGEYAQKVADTEFGNALTDHVKTSEDGLSMAEARKVSKNTKDWIKEVADAVDNPEKLQKLIEREEAGEYRQQFLALTDKITSELVASGVPQYSNVRKVRQYARLEAASIVRLARLGNIKPEKVMEFAPRIVGQRTEIKPQDITFKADATARSDALKDMQSKEPSLNEWVKKHEEDLNSGKVKAKQKSATFTPTQVDTKAKSVIIQNRNRNRPGLIAQMNAIAAKPDYNLVSFSRDFGNGAPVVAYGFVPENQLGKEDYAVTADHRTIKVRYAIVEADSVMTSNRYDGTVNPEYDNAPNTQMRAIAGNGRIAGLTEAYNRGTASEYRKAMIKDSALTGIDPGVAATMKNPILVRVMPANEVTENIGDVSNTSTTAELSALQRANNDANRIDLSRINFNEDGRITKQTVLDFVQQMPESELDALITKDGNPTSQAYERLTYAIIAKAYQDDELTELLAESNSDEARNIFRALVSTGPKFIRLLDTPMDMRAVIVQIAHLAVNAQREGLGFSKYLTTAPFGIDPEVLRLARNVAETIRSSKETTAIFEELADDGYEVVNQMADQEEGLLGVEGGSLEDVWGNAQISSQGSVLQNLNDKIELRRNEAAEVEDTDSGSLFQLVGEKGAAELDRQDGQARLDSLQVARNMESQQKTAKEIRLATGWERGADGKWRYEIPDVELKETPKVTTDYSEAIRYGEAWMKEHPNATEEEQWELGSVAMEKYPPRTIYPKYSLEELVNAKELFNAYPQLKKIKVEFAPLEQGALGGFYRETGTIVLSTELLREGPFEKDFVKQNIQKTLVHEIQHAIQHIEGFAKGSNPRLEKGLGDLLLEDMKKLHELAFSKDWLEYVYASKKLSYQTRNKNDIFSKRNYPNYSEGELQRLAENSLSSFRKDFEDAKRKASPLEEKIKTEQARLKEKWGTDNSLVNQVIEDPTEYDSDSGIWSQLNESDPSYQIRNYANQAGEVEARNVSNRLKLSPDQCRETLLAETQDVATEDQNFLFQALNKDAANRGAYSPSQNLIRLTDNADLSTFAHEMSHWYLTNLFDLVRAGATGALSEDVQAILNDWGIDSLASWDSMSFEEQRKFQERFAYQTEIYLATGEAPSNKLRKAFQNLGRWIRDVYRTWVGGVAQQRGEQYRIEFGEDLPQLSEEVRRVMDRMLWSDEQIKQAEAMEGIRPLFETKPDDMSDEMWAELQKERFNAIDEGAELLLRNQAKDERWYINARARVLKKLEARGEQIRNNVRRRVAESINNSKAVKTLHAIKEAASKGAGDWRMDPNSLRAMNVSENDIATLTKMGLTKEGGLTPTQLLLAVKSIADYQTPQRLINVLLNVSDIKALIEDTTTKICLNNHSVFYGRSRDELVTKALQSEARARLLATELQYLMKDKTMTNNIIRQTARRAAEALVNRTTLGKLRPRGLLAGQRRAARKSYEALTQGNKQLAALYKRQQLVYMEASLMVLDLEKQISRASRLKSIIFRGDKKISKNYDMDLINVCRYIMTNEGLGFQAKREFDPTKAFKFIQNLEKYDQIKFNALKPILDKHNRAGDRSMYDMTVKEFQEVLEDVESIYTMAREAKQLHIDNRVQAVEDVVKELINQADANNLMQPSTAGRNETISYKERTGLKMLAGLNCLKRVETWCNQMDAVNPNHPFRSRIYDPIAKAAARYRNANSSIQQKLVELMLPLQKDWFSRTNIYSSELGYNFTTKAELVSALLHTGNLSNKTKLLLGGRGEGREWAQFVTDDAGNEYLDTSKWDNFIARCQNEGIITEADMDFCQAVWDLLEETKPLAQKAYHRMYGRYFKEVEATSFKAFGKTYRGGYVPAKVDPNLVADMAAKNEATRIVENDFTFLMPVNDPGFAQTRVENYHKPLLLDLRALCNHVDSVLRFAYIAPDVTDVAKVVTNKEFREYFDKRDPSLINDFLMPWLNRAYNQTVGDGKTDWISSTANKLRGIAGINIMFGHVVNAMQQLTGFSIALQKVKPVYLLRAFKYLACCPTTVKEISAMSDFMKARFDDRSIEFLSKMQSLGEIGGTSIRAQKGLFNKLVALDKKADPIRNLMLRYGYFAQTLMQAPIDTVIWMGAYQQAIEGGRTHDQAVMDADSVIRTTQSDFAPENVSSIETGSALWRFFLVFYNYFNMQLNMVMEGVTEAKLEKSMIRRYGKYLKTAVLVVIIPGALAELIQQAFFNDLDTGDDDDLDALDLARIITASTAKNALAMVPLAGGMVQTGLAHLANDKNAGAFQTVSQWLVGTDPYAGRIMSSPGLGLIESVGKGTKTIIDIGMGADVKARTATRNILDLTSAITRIPFGALKKPLGYGAALANDEVHPEDTVEMLQGFLSGRERRK